MWKFMRLYRDPEANPDNKGGGEPAPGESAEALALEQELLNEVGLHDISKDKDAGTAGKDDVNKTADNNKGSGAAADKGSTDDPEYDIDFKDDKGGVSKQKVKLSELKNGYLRQDDYTKKTQRLSEIENNQKDLITTVEAIRQNPKLAKLFVGLVEGAIKKDAGGKGYYDEAFIDKQLNGLQSVQAAPDDSKKDLKDKNEDIEDMLKDVDPDSPIAKALRVTMAQNKQLMADIQNVKNAQEGTRSIIDESTRAEAEKQYQALVTEAGKMMNDHLDGMTDTAKGGLEFFTPGEKQEWRFKVVAFLRDNPVEYKDDKEFIKRIDEAGKAVHNYMVKFREEIIAQKLEGNKLKKTVEPVADKPSADQMTLEEELQKELDSIGS